MKIATIVFFIIVAEIALTYTKVYKVHMLIILGTIVLWCIIMYIKIHLKNKERRMPRPVYMTHQPPI